MIKIKEVLNQVIKISPYVFLFNSLYCSFLIIIPFFLLGVDKVDIGSIYNDEISYEKAFSILGVVIAFCSALFFSAIGILWILSFINYLKYKRIWVLVLLLIGPYPIAYIRASEYSSKMLSWIYNL